MDKVFQEPHHRNWIEDRKKNIISNTKSPKGLGDLDPFTRSVYDPEGRLKFRNVAALLNFDKILGQKQVEKGQRTLTFLSLINLQNHVTQGVLFAYMHKLGIGKEVKIKRTFAYKLKDLGMDKVIVFSENATSSHRLKETKRSSGLLGWKRNSTEKRWNYRTPSFYYQSTTLFHQAMIIKTLLTFSTSLSVLASASQPHFTFPWTYGSA